MTTTASWVTAVRHSHDRFADLVRPLDASGVEAPSYASEWTIADVSSHLGSQAEIFGLFLDSGMSGGAAPGGEAFQPIWARWNAKAPTEQVADSVVGNEAFVARLEGLSDSEREAFALSMFGMDLDLAGFAGMRLGEHALHVWDIAVALDSAAVLPAEVAELLIDRVGSVAQRGGKPADAPRTIIVETSEPVRRFAVTTGPAVALVADEGDAAVDLSLPAEALIRLVYGRLDPDHTPEGVGGDEGLLAELRPVFPGF